MTRKTGRIRQPCLPPDVKISSRVRKIPRAVGKVTPSTVELFAVRMG
jgi:hypothetical protein